MHERRTLADGLFEVNPALDVAGLTRAFGDTPRIQIRDVLTDRSARAVLDVLARQTPWGLAWQAGGNGPHPLRREAVAALTPPQRQEMSEQLTRAMQGRDYSFLYGQYPLVTAYLEKWQPGGPLEQVLEAINSAPFMDLVRTVTGIAELVKADGQATLYAPNQFLAIHDDEEAAKGRRIAYVLSLCAEDWRPDWGGYLNFYDADGDVVAGFKPRFNALNLFAVPQVHNVTMVPWFGPAAARFALTGWFRDR